MFAKNAKRSLNKSRKGFLERHTKLSLIFAVLVQSQGEAEESSCKKRRNKSLMVSHEQRV
jgi:hypothetical protein